MNVRSTAESHLGPLQDHFSTTLSRVVLLLSLAITCNFAWVTPFNFIPDETAHYLRAYEVSRLKLYNTETSNGVDIPCREYLQVVYINGRPQLPDRYLPDVNGREDDESCVFNTRAHANAYPFVPYSFAAAGFWLADTAGIEDAYWKTIIGRTLNAVFCTFLALAGFRFSLAQLGVLFVYFLPATQSQIGSLSADGMSLALAARMALTLVSGLSQPASVSPLPIIRSLALIGGALAATKVTLGVLALAPLALWKVGWNEAGARRNTPLGWICLAALIGTIISTPLIQPFILAYSSPRDQLAYLVGNPLAVLPIAFATFREFGTSWMAQIVRPYPTQSVFPFLILATGMVLTCITALARLTTARRLWLLIILLLSCAAPAAAMYLTWNPIGSPMVHGVQARYFLPGLFLLPLIIANLSPVRYRPLSIIAFVLSPGSSIAVLCMMMVTFSWTL